MHHRRIWLVLIVAVALSTGCSKKATTTATADQETYKACARKFGEALLKKDFKAAYDMMSPLYKGQVSLEKFQQNYDMFKKDWEASIAAHLPGFHLEPNKLEVDSGHLPSSQEDGKDTYGIPTYITADTWRAWLMDELIEQNGDDRKGGFEARVLVVSEAGQLRIGHVEYGFID